MKCVICKMSAKGKDDFERHIRVAHNLTRSGYTVAAKAINDAAQKAYIGARVPRMFVIDPFSLAVAAWLLVYAGFGSVAAGRAANESVKFRPITPPSALEIAHGWRADFYRTHEFIGGRWMPKLVRS